MGRTLLLSVLVVFSLAALVSGAVPQLINYQGVLTDGAGTIVPNGSNSITFNLYQQPAGGSSEWTQTSPVTVVGGIFNVTLGDLPIWLFEHPTYLGISIDGGSEMTPRRELVASPYALTAATVQDSSIHQFKIMDGNLIRSLNGLTDHVNLVAGSNISIPQSGSAITISAAGGWGGGGS